MSTSFNEYNLYGDDQIDINYYDPVVDVNLPQTQLKKEGFASCSNNNQNSWIVDQGLSKAVKDKLNNLYSTTLQRKPPIPQAQKRDAARQLQSYFTESQMDCIRSNIESHYVAGCPGGDVWVPGKCQTGQRVLPVGADQQTTTTTSTKETFVGCPCEKTKDANQSWWGGNSENILSWNQHSSMVLQFLLLIIFVVMIMQYNMLSSIEQNMRMHHFMVSATKTT